MTMKVSQICTFLVLIANLFDIFWQGTKYKLWIPEDAGMIIRCMAENYNEGEEKIQECRDCFKNIGDVMSETGAYESIL